MLRACREDKFAASLEQYILDLIFTPYYLFDYLNIFLGGALVT